MGGGTWAVRFPRVKSDTNVTQKGGSEASGPPCLVPKLLPELVELTGIEPVTS